MTLGALVAMAFIACSETKYVADGDYLLDRVVVRSDQKGHKINVSDLKQYVRQQGNSRWFSTLKVPLRTYSLSGRDTTRWLNRTLRNIGEPPQLYDTLLALQSQQNLQMQLQNLGYLRAKVDIKNEVRGKKLKSTY